MELLRLPESQIPVIPTSKAALKLFHEGFLALGDIEVQGMPLCPAALNESGHEIDQKIREESEFLRSQPIYETQRRIFGKSTGIGKREQLARVLYDEMKLPGALRSKKTGKYIMDDDALESFDHIPYIQAFRRLSKLHKIKSTYIDGLRDEIVDGRIHAFLELTKVKSFRGSSNGPNLQNLPSRDANAKYLKQCVKPKPGHYIVEIDYSALEVHISQCYHQDPTMLEYLISGYDMHSDMAKMCFKYDDAWAKENKKLHKSIRTAVKGTFVFAALYGATYKSITMGLWRDAQKLGLVGHLASRGITKQGMEFDGDTGKWNERLEPDALVTHIKAVEHDFWKRRFKVYDDWKTSWYNSYQKRGYFESLTGFTWHGVESKNFIINAPNQGSAFHCLLQSIVDIGKEIKRRKMDSRMFLEIHDSLLAEVPACELHDYVAMATNIMTTKLRQKWPWIILDLKTEVECSPISWWDKVAYTGSEA